MEFFASDSFLKALRKLENKPRFYKNVREDLENEFTRLPTYELNDVQKLGDVIYEVKEGNTKIFKKVRLPNSHMREGKSGGYRVILSVDIERNWLVFLSIYPKKGKLGTSDLSKAEYEDIFEEYLIQLENGSLEKFWDDK